MSRIYVFNSKLAFVRKWLFIFLLTRRKIAEVPGISYCIQWNRKLLSGYSSLLYKVKTAFDQDYAATVLQCGNRKKRITAHCRGVPLHSVRCFKAWFTRVSTSSKLLTKAAFGCYFGILKLANDEQNRGVSILFILSLVPSGIAIIFNRYFPSIWSYSERNAEKYAANNAVVVTIFQGCATSWVDCML